MPAMPPPFAGARENELAPETGARLQVSVPDAERLMLQSRFVRSRPEAEILNELEARIRGARLVDPWAVPPDLVTMNSQILLRDVDTGRRKILTLAFPSRASAREGRLSVLTPLGSKLLGARVGQRIPSPAADGFSARGSGEFLVEAILHQPEAAGDYYG